MRKLFKRLGIFIEGVAIETQRQTSTSERRFLESPGVFVSLGSQNMEDLAFDLFQLNPGSTAPFCIKIWLSCSPAACPTRASAL